MCAGLLDHAITPRSGKEPDAFRPRLIVADDNEQLLARVVTLLAKEFHIVGTVSNGRALVEAAGRLHPDIIVCDITMPDIDGLEAVRRLRDIGSNAKVVYLTVHDDSDYLREGLSIGAMGYVIKDKLLTDLLHALREVLAGRRFVSDSSNLQL
jgi:DNA-binding NarL/FixJ family response regulator